MAPRLKPVMSELRRAIDHARPVDAFNIYLANTRGETCFKSLMRGTPENKRQATAFTEKAKAQDKGAVTPALKLAVAHGATQIYLLANESVPDIKEAIQFLRKTNEDREPRIKVTTIAFIDRGKYHDALKQIADENAGIFKFVDEADVSP